MGAGASAASMPLPERRELYAEMRAKYTRSDLDELAEEEKQAWLEVIEEQKEAEAKGAAELNSTAPEVTVRRAAEAAAALTGATSGRKSGWDLSGQSDTGVRPQGTETRMSFILAAQTDGADADGNGGGNAADDGGGLNDLSPEGAADVGGEKRRHRGSLPAWKKTAEELETPTELCVGDVVRARDKGFNGMWFEGVLTAIHDETTFEVELAGDEEEEDSGSGPHRITVGIDDVIRVLPWFCIEVGDMVECQLEGTMSWVRGTVVNVDRALYDVALESELDDDQRAGGENETGANGAVGGREGGDCKENEDEGVLYRIPESRIRKIISGRQAAAKRWRKMYLASILTSGLGRLVKETREGCEEE